MKQEINEQAFCPDVTGKWDPLVSDPTRQRNKNRAGGATLLAWPELADGEFAGGDIFTA